MRQYTLFKEKFSLLAFTPYNNPTCDFHKYMSNIRTPINKTFIS